MVKTLNTLLICCALGFQGRFFLASASAQEAKKPAVKSGDKVSNEKLRSFYKHLSTLHSDELQELYKDLIRRVDRYIEEQQKYQSGGYSYSYYLKNVEDVQDKLSDDMVALTETSEYSELMAYLVNRSRKQALFVYPLYLLIIDKFDKKYADKISTENQVKGFEYRSYVGTLTGFVTMALLPKYLQVFRYMAPVLGTAGGRIYSRYRERNIDIPAHPLSFLLAEQNWNQEELSREEANIDKFAYSAALAPLLYYSADFGYLKLTDADGAKAKARECNALFSFLPIPKKVFQRTKNQIKRTVKEFDFLQFAVSSTASSLATLGVGSYFSSKSTMSLENIAAHIQDLKKEINKMDTEEDKLKMYLAGRRLFEEYKELYDLLRDQYSRALINVKGHQELLSLYDKDLDKDFDNYSGRLQDIKSQIPLPETKMNSLEQMILGENFLQKKRFKNHYGIVALDGFAFFSQQKLPQAILFVGMLRNYEQERKGNFLGGQNEKE